MDTIKQGEYSSQLVDSDKEVEATHDRKLATVALCGGKEMRCSKNWNCRENIEGRASRYSLQGKK